MGTIRVSHDQITEHAGRKGSSYMTDDNFILRRLGICGNLGNREYGMGGGSAIDFSIRISYTCH